MLTQEWIKITAWARRAHHFVFHETLRTTTFETTHRSQPMVQAGTVAHQKSAKGGSSHDRSERQESTAETTLGGTVRQHDARTVNVRRPRGRPPHRGPHRRVHLIETAAKQRSAASPSTTPRAVLRSCRVARTPLILFLAVRGPWRTMRRPRRFHLGGDRPVLIITNIGRSTGLRRTSDDQPLAPRGTRSAMAAHLPPRRGHWAPRTSDTTNDPCVGLGDERCREVHPAEDVDRIEEARSGTRLTHPRRRRHPRR